MNDRQLQARLLDEEAAEEIGLARAQALAAQADRLRHTPRVSLLSRYPLPLLRN